MIDCTISWTPEQLQAMYKKHLLQQFDELNDKYGGYKMPVDRVCTPMHPHDVWNAYDYGGDIVKVVYIKRAPKINNALNRDETVFTKENALTSAPHNDGERFSQSISRSKARVFELAMCNEFKYFCTFTQDEKLRDRFNLTEFRKDFAMLVRNLNRTRSEENKIKYLLIPEEHKIGAWHMHGFLKGLTDTDLREFKTTEHIPQRIKKMIKNGQKVYDWTRYRRSFGYFTCTEIENTTACSKYITKYITKDLQKNARENNEHLFFASQGLNGRRVLARNSFEPCPVDNWDFENDYVKIKEIKISNSEK